jgi:putative N-acetylmannosamine-6-phosphate epimerase
MKKMIKLPKSGLIACTQTYDWRKYRCNYAVIEIALIDILANNKNIVALRIDNPLLISYAKNKYKNLFVLGMIKDHDYSNYITPTLDHYTKCIEAGADAVAVDFRDYDRVQWVLDNGLVEYIWPDIDTFEKAKNILDTHDFPIISSTFCKEQDFFLDAFSDYNLLDRLNIEGNVNHEDFGTFYKEARYVTIGRAIHDPNTIIENLI